MEKSEFMAYLIISVGLILLILTFTISYFMVMSVVSITASQDFSEAIAFAIGPLAEAIIRLIFLAIMGWSGSVITVRGIQLYREAKTWQLKSQELLKSEQKS